MSARQGPDRCPGLLRTFAADDGAIVRLRIPGGRVPVRVLADLMHVAEQHGTAFLQLTSRGAVQLRAMPDPLPEALLRVVDDAGLLGSPTHERARSILAAPLAPSLQPLVAQLDAAIVSTPGLADLPGRFLWAFADARGSILGEPWDVAYQELAPDSGLLLVADHAAPIPRRDAVSAMVDRALRFLAERRDERVWNVRDLPPGSRVVDGLSPHRLRAAPPLPTGPVGGSTTDGAVGTDLVTAVPLGLLRSTHLQALAEVTDVVVLTPWRSLVVPAGAAAAARLADSGLGVTVDSPWARVTACVGAPYCRRTHVRTLDLATSAARQLSGPGPGVHVAGCERACGRPAAQPVTLVAPTGVGQVLAAAAAW